MSKLIMNKTDAWDSFADDVLDHIEEYVLPQYGDTGDDLATEYTFEDCVRNIQRYVARAGKNSRPGQDVLDMIKIAHYAQMAYHKLIDAQLAHNALINNK